MLFDNQLQVFVVLVLADELGAWILLKGSGDQEIFHSHHFFSGDDRRTQDNAHRNVEKICLEKTTTSAPPMAIKQNPFLPICPNISSFLVRTASIVLAVCASLHCCRQVLLRQLRCNIHQSVATGTKQVWVSKFNLPRGGFSSVWVFRTHLQSQ